MSPTLFPLGDNAITIDYGNVINEETNKIVLARFRQLQEEPLPQMTEAVPAYSSLTIYYDPFALRSLSPKGTAYTWMKQQVEEWLAQKTIYKEKEERTIKIPVCYDGSDLGSVMKNTGLVYEDIVSIHSSVIYRIYMLGFLPGFSYMGQLDQRLFTNRKKEPTIVEAGSVAITGLQTGIYPLRSPGGWSVIGRTPFKLFEPTDDSPVLLSAGDRVKFFAITNEEFNSYKKNGNKDH